MRAAAETAGAGHSQRAARIDTPDSHAVAVVEQPVPDPGAGEVLVRSAAAGICGSDVELLRGTRPPELCSYPVIPGHEWSGTVAAVGAGVRGLTPGDEVVCEGMLRCGACTRCRTGQPNLCESGYAELGFTRPGGCARYVVVPVDAVHRLPASLLLEEAALLEPAAVTAHAFGRAPSPAGRNVAVVGDGTLGQLAAQFARAGGAAHTALVGLVSSRLELARSLGADATYDGRDGGGDGPTVAERYQAEVAAGGADLVVETGGSVAAVELALGLARRGGTVVLAGIAGGGSRLSLDPDLFATRELSVHGVLGSTPASWEQAIALAGSGAVRLGPLITHRYGLERVAAAFATAAGDREAVKVLVLHDSDS